jgi:hypothetical protein
MARHFLPHCLAVLLSLACSPFGQAQDSAAARIVGTYHGQVLNGGDFDPVTTIFVLTPDGRLTGQYSADDESGLVEGRISGPMFEGPRTLSFEWTDKYGEGYAWFEFSADYRSFTGYWSDQDSTSMNPWNGARVE